MTIQRIDSLLDPDAIRRRCRCVHTINFGAGDSPRAFSIDRRGMFA